MSVHITEHALQRYCERVKPCNEDEARADLSNERIQRIIAFGAKFFRLGTGHRVVVKDGTIVTILPLEARSKTHRLRRRQSND